MNPGRKLSELAVLSALAVSCNSEKGPLGPAIGAVQVSVTTTGVELQQQGYGVSIDSGVGQAIPVNGTVMLSGLSAGSHSIQLVGLAPNCAAGGGANPRRVDISAGDTAHVAFAVTCLATRGSVAVAFATTGTDLDPDGYSVSADGGIGQAVAASGSVTFSGLSAGSHTVSVSGVATNCTARPPSPISVTITAGVATPLNVAVNCIPIVRRTGQIAFISNSCDAAGNCADDIYVVNADGSNPIRLTTTSGMYGSPVWSPSGAQILYAAGSGDVVVNADGSHPYLLNTGGAWSPDGARIAFSNSGQIDVMNADGTDTTRLTSDGGQSPTWSPDGARIAFSNSGQIYVINTDGTSLTRLTNPSDIVGAGGPYWSPGGAKLVFTANGQIYVINADGTSVTTLNTLGQPIWSPDGTRILIWTDSQLYVVNADGTNSIRVGADHVWEPAWSPDGKQIVFTTSAYGGNAYVVNADGSNLHKLITDPQVYSFGRAAWSPTGTTLAAGLFYGGAFLTVYLLNPDGTNIVPLRCNCYVSSDNVAYNPAWSPRIP